MATQLRTEPAPPRGSGSPSVARAGGDVVARYRPVAAPASRHVPTTPKPIPPVTLPPDFTVSISVTLPSAASSLPSDSVDVEPTVGDCGAFNRFVLICVCLSVALCGVYIFLVWMRKYVPTNPRRTTVALPYALLQAAVSSALWNVLSVIIVFEVFYNAFPSVLPWSMEAACMTLTFAPVSTPVLLFKGISVSLLYNSHRVVRSIGDLVNPTYFEVPHRPSVMAHRPRGSSTTTQVTARELDEVLEDAPATPNTDVEHAAPEPLLSQFPNTPVWNEGDSEGPTPTERTLHLGVFAHGALLVDAIQKRQVGILRVREFYAVDLSPNASLRPFILHNITAKCHLSQEEAAALLISSTPSAELQLHLPFADGYFSRIVVAPYTRYNRPINNLLTTERFKQVRMAAILNEAIRVLAPGGVMEGYDTKKCAEYLEADFADAGLRDCHKIDTGCSLALLPRGVSLNCFAVYGVKPSAPSAAEEQCLREIKELYGIPLRSPPRVSSGPDQGDAGAATRIERGSVSPHDEAEQRNAMVLEVPLLHSDFGAKPSQGGAAPPASSDGVRRVHRYLILCSLQLVIWIALCLAALSVFSVLNYPTAIVPDGRINTLPLHVALAYPTIAVVHREAFWLSTEVYPTVGRVLCRVLPVEALIVAWCATISLTLAAAQLGWYAIFYVLDVTLTPFVVSLLSLTLVVPVAVVTMRQAITMMERGSRILRRIAWQ